MTTTLATTRLLLLDFDGVIADSVDECVAVTWYVDLGVGGEESLMDLFHAIPAQFVDKFHQLRPYSRTLEDFLVAKHHAGKEIVHSQRDFDAIKATISPDAQASFARAATELRGRWRDTQRQQWLDSHTIFDGIADILRRFTGHVFVITAKDEASSSEILEHFGLAHHVAAVVGEVHDKALAARCLCLGRGLEPADVLFIDDNLTNVSQVQSAGIPSRWATWGWTAPEHRSRAEQLRLAPIDLVDLADI